MFVCVAARFITVEATTAETVIFSSPSTVNTTAGQTGTLTVTVHDRYGNLRNSSILKFDDSAVLRLFLDGTFLSLLFDVCVFSLSVCVFELTCGTGNPFSCEPLFNLDVRFGRVFVIAIVLTFSDGGNPVDCDLPVVDGNGGYSVGCNGTVAQVSTVTARVGTAGLSADTGSLNVIPDVTSAPNSLLDNIYIPFPGVAKADGSTSTNFPNTSTSIGFVARDRFGNVQIKQDSYVAHENDFSEMPTRV